MVFLRKHLQRMWNVLSSLKQHLIATKSLVKVFKSTFVEKDDRSEPIPRTVQGGLNLKLSVQTGP